MEKWIIVNSQVQLPSNLFKMLGMVAYNDSSTDEVETGGYLSSGQIGWIILSAADRIAQIEGIS